MLRGISKGPIATKLDPCSPGAVELFATAIRVIFARLLRLVCCLGPFLADGNDLFQNFTRLAPFDIGLG